MKYYRLKQVYMLLGNTPKPGTLRDWCRKGLIPHSRTVGGHVYLMSEEQIAALRVQLEQGCNDAQTSETKSGGNMARAR